MNRDPNQSQNGTSGLPWNELEAAFSKIPNDNVLHPGVSPYHIPFHWACDLERAEQTGRQETVTQVDGSLSPNNASSFSLEQ
jgi:hypothetical protein